MAKKKPLTEDEWVRRVNAMGLEIDEYAASVHPSVWKNDEHLKDLKKRYLKLAGVVTERSVWPGEAR